MTTPTHSLKADDGTGTFPIDLTSRLERQAGVNVSGYGRSDEFTQAQASTFSCTLNNNDGGVSTGAGFGTMPFGTSPFGGSTRLALQPGTLIRWTLTVGGTTVNRFTGRITSLDLGWEGAPGKRATVTLNASDLLADLSRRPLRSMLEEEILADTPTAYYTLSEAEGSTTAGDTSGKGAASLSIAGTGAPLTFGTGTGPGTDGLSAVQFFGGQYLKTSLPGVTTGLDIEFYFAASADGTILTAPASNLGGTADNVTVSLSSGNLIVAVNRGVGSPPSTFVTTSGTNYADGATHQVVVVLGDVGGSIYVDGASRATASWSFTVIGYDLTNLQVGNGFTGTLSHLAVFPALNGTMIAAHYAMSSGASETTSARLARLCSYAGMTPTTVSPSGRLMGAQSTSGASLFDAIQSVAAAEGGVVFADGSGTITMQGRDYRTLKTTADFTAGTDVDPGTTVPWDDQLLYNKVTVTRTGGAVQVVPNTTSLPEHPLEIELPVVTDTDALAAAQWIVAKHQTPSPRTPTLTFDPLSSPRSAAMLGIKIGDRIALPNLPTQWWGTAGDFVVEGWSEAVSHDSWELTLNVVPWTLYQAALWGSATWGSSVWTY